MAAATQLRTDNGIAADGDGNLRGVFVTFVAALCGCCEKYEEEEEFLEAPTLPEGEEEDVKNPAWILQQLEKMPDRDRLDNAIQFELEVRRRKRAQEEWDRCVAKDPLHNQPWLKYRPPPLPPPQKNRPPLQTAPLTADVVESHINNNNKTTKIALPPTPSIFCGSDDDNELRTLTFSSHSQPSSSKDEDGTHEEEEEEEEDIFYSSSNINITSSNISSSSSLFSDFTSPQLENEDERVLTNKRTASSCSVFSDSVSI